MRSLPFSNHRGFTHYAASLAGNVAFLLAFVISMQSSPVMAECEDSIQYTFCQTTYSLGSEEEFRAEGCQSCCGRIGCNANHVWSKSSKADAKDLKIQGKSEIGDAVSGIADSVINEVISAVTTDLSGFLGSVMGSISGIIGEMFGNLFSGITDLFGSGGTLSTFGQNILVSAVSDSSFGDFNIGSILSGSGASEIMKSLEVKPGQIPLSEDAFGFATRVKFANETEYPTFYPRSTTAAVAKNGKSFLKAGETETQQASKPVAAGAPTFILPASLGINNNASYLITADSVMTDSMDSAEVTFNDYMDKQLGQTHNIATLTGDLLDRTVFSNLEATDQYRKKQVESAAIAEIKDAMVRGADDRGVKRFILDNQAEKLKACRDKYTSGAKPDKYIKVNYDIEVCKPLKPGTATNGSGSGQSGGGIVDNLLGQVGGAIGGAAGGAVSGAIGGIGRSGDMELEDADSAQTTNPAGKSAIMDNLGNAVGGAAGNAVGGAIGGIFGGNTTGNNSTAAGGENAAFLFCKCISENDKSINPDSGNIGTAICKKAIEGLKDSKPDIKLDGTMRSWVADVFFGRDALKGKQKAKNPAIQKFLDQFSGPKGTLEAALAIQRLAGDVCIGNNSKGEVVDVLIPPVETTAALTQKIQGGNGAACKDSQTFVACSDSAEKQANTSLTKTMLDLIALKERLIPEYEAGKLDAQVALLKAGGIDNPIAFINHLRRMDEPMAMTYVNQAASLGAAEIVRNAYEGARATLQQAGLQHLTDPRILDTLDRPFALADRDFKNIPVGGAKITASQAELAAASIDEGQRGAANVGTQATIEFNKMAGSMPPFGGAVGLDNPAGSPS